MVYSIKSKGTFPSHLSNNNQIAQRKQTMSMENLRSRLVSVNLQEQTNCFLQLKKVICVECLNFLNSMKEEVKKLMSMPKMNLDTLHFMLLVVSFLMSMIKFYRYCFITMVCRNSGVVLLISVNSYQCDSRK